MSYLFRSRVGYSPPPFRIDRSAGSLQSRASITLTHRLHKVRKKRTEHSRKNSTTLLIIWWRGKEHAHCIVADKPDL